MKWEPSSIAQTPGVDRLLQIHLPCWHTLRHREVSFCSTSTNQSTYRMHCLGVVIKIKIYQLGYCLSVNKNCSYHCSSSLSRTSPGLYALLCLHWHCSWGIQPLSEISSNTVPAAATSQSRFRLKSMIEDLDNVFISFSVIVYVYDWPGGQKQPSIMWSSHSELVSVFEHVSIHGDPLSENSMLKGHFTARWVKKQNQVNIL